MTASMVPVCSITSRNVIAGVVGSRPMSFSAMITCAELETGSNSQNPCTSASTNTLSTTGIAYPRLCVARLYRGPSALLQVLGYSGEQTASRAVLRGKHADTGAAANLVHLVEQVDD